MCIMVYDILNWGLQVIERKMANKARFQQLLPLLHSVKDIPGSVRACTVIGGGCVFRHVTKWVLSRIGTPLPLASLYSCSANPR